MVEFFAFTIADDLINRQLVKNCPACECAETFTGKDGISVSYEVRGSVCRLLVETRIVPTCVLGRVIKSCFEKHPEVRKISIDGLGCNYKRQLTYDHRWVLDLPDTVDELNSRIGRKGLYNVRRSEKKLAEELGVQEIAYQRFEKDAIPHELVQEYFELKKKTHGVDYELQPADYLSQYHITGAMKLSAGGNLIAVLFYCVNGSTVFLENISYNESFAKWSPGIVLYLHFLRSMTSEKIVKRIFLGGGWQPYKERFGGRCYKTYHGFIFRNPLTNFVFAIANQLRHRVLDVFYGKAYR